MSYTYTNTPRNQYITAGGLPIDLVGSRNLIDPTPAMLSLFTDAERLQWGTLLDWGFPPVFVNMELSDGGTSGSPGFGAVDNSIVMRVLVPPTVEDADVCAVMSGAIKVKIQSNADTTGILLQNGAGAGAHSYDDPNAGVMHWGVGLGLSSLPSRSLAVTTTSTREAFPQTVTLTVTVTRNDANPKEAGFGGVLWGLGFRWVRPALNTYSAIAGDTASSASV